MCSLIPFVNGLRERVASKDNGNISLPVAQQGRCLQQRALARKALAANRDVRPSQVVKQRHMASWSVAERLRKSDRIGSRPTIYGGALVKGLCKFNTTEAGGEDYSNP
jgi:hypothetical protein